MASQLEQLAEWARVADRMGVAADTSAAVAAALQGGEGPLWRRIVQAAAQEPRGVAIGKTAAAGGAALDVVGDVSVEGRVTSDRFVARHSFMTMSDARLKADVVPLRDALSAVLALEPVTYVLRAEPTRTHVGFVAQQVQAVAPALVAQPAGAGGMLGVQYDRVTALLVGAAQSMALEARALRAVVVFLLVCELLSGSLGPHHALAAVAAAWSMGLGPHPCR
jgi:hypothetical protein